MVDADAGGELGRHGVEGWLLGLLGSVSCC
jgi:hypothetical protein